MHLTQGQNSSHSPISLSFWLANLIILSYEGKDKTHTDVGLTDEDFPEITLVISLAQFDLYSR